MITTLNLLALLLAGYSIFCAASIAWTHFGGEAYREQPTARLMGWLLLAALSGLQAAHGVQVYLGEAWTQNGLYRMALFAVAPSFYLFSAPVLRPAVSGVPDRPALAPWRQSLHLLPVLLAPVCPPAIARPLAFFIGVGYLFWLGRRLFALRQARERFSLEMVLLGGAVLIAGAMAVLALVPAVLPEAVFTPLYAVSIGLALLLVQTTLGLRPQLSAEVEAVAQARYQTTTLGHVDCETTLARLQELMEKERVFMDPALSLASLAERVQVSAHQLSELLNSRLGRGFARYVREQRIQAAKDLLCRQPGASVLSVGMSIGFTSQSNFYEAFREIEGSTPGQYRKLHLKRPASAAAGPGAPPRAPPASE